MSVEILTPETLTFDIIKGWDGATMKKYMQVPSMREAIYRVVQTQSLADVEAAQEQIEATPSAEVPPVEPVVPAEIIDAEPGTRVRVGEASESVVVPAVPKKIVVEYQIKDEDGNPIGRPTHLEAASEEEMRQKMMEAHTQATRAFHRLKKQKVQSLRDVNNQPAVPAVEPAFSDAELLAAVRDLKSDDPKVALEAHRKLNKAEVDRVKAEADAKLAAVNETRRQEQVSFMFLKAHQNDFNNCEANRELVKNYFQENELAWTLDNLEIAFHALENELAPVAAPVVATPPANPAPVVATVPATPAAVPVVQPAPAALVTPTPPANPAPAQPRPGVNTGIIPGQNSAPRPNVTQKGLTMEEIHSWDGPTMRAKMRNPQLRAEIERVVAAAKITRGR